MIIWGQCAHIFKMFQNEIFDSFPEIEKLLFFCWYKKKATFPKKFFENMCMLCAYNYYTHCIFVSRFDYHSRQIIFRFHAQKTETRKPEVENANPNIGF